VGLLLGTGMTGLPLASVSTGITWSGVGFGVAPPGGVLGVDAGGVADVPLPEPEPLGVELGLVVLPAVGPAVVGAGLPLGASCNVAPAGTSKDCVTMVPSVPIVVMMIETVAWVDAGASAAKPRLSAKAGSMDKDHQRFIGGPAFQLRSGRGLPSLAGVGPEIVRTGESSSLAEP
jgi:hypothetical protein